MFNPEMILVEGGTFMMGSEDPKKSWPDERPIHPVTISDFEIGKYPVTQREWEAVMGSNPSHFKDCPDNPVENVSWNRVQKFLVKLNALTGLQYRLPTEAEWEFAARGGNKSQGYEYSGSNDLEEVAWTYENTNGTTRPVGQKKPNELGIYDMSGNVWEWCQDWQGPYPSSAQTNPIGPSISCYKSRPARVMRGGSSRYLPTDVRVAVRGFFKPGFRLKSPYCLGYGFRLARSL